jgi:tripartite-type tricarboxylate transporter receptor subunit TctC
MPRIVAGLLLVVQFLASLANASESYPSRPIRLIVPFPAGSQPDTVARVISESLSSSFGTVVVENRPGAGGTTGMRAAAAAEPDGYTLALGTTGSLALAPALLPNAGYDPVGSFAPVAQIASAPFMIVVAPSVPVRTFSEFVAYLKSNPGKLNYGASPASPPQFACESFKSATATQFVHVMSRGPQAVADLLGGHVEIMCEATTVLLPLVVSGTAKPIVVMNAARLPELPDVPTAAEMGYPELAMAGWTGLVAPSQTPAAVIDRLNKAVERALAASPVQDRFRNLGTVPRFLPAHEFRTFIAEEAKRWAGLVQRSGIKPP